MSMANSSNMNQESTLPAKGDAMSKQEIRSSASLAGVFALRMLGLFLILPVFSLHAQTLPDGNNAVLVGLAMGMYGLCQAICQIPLGMASDRIGRKPVIVAGLILFALGSVWAALADSVMGILIGRAIQGSGAISAALTALIADTTREQHRTKAMAMVGGSIGISFALSLVMAPALYQALGMSGIFFLTAALALCGIAVVLKLTPSAPALPLARVPLRQVLAMPELMRLNYGVFVLHLSQMAMFVVLPAYLVNVVELPLSQHWKLYLPVMVLSFFTMLPAIMYGEKNGKMKTVFVAAIALLCLVLFAFSSALQHRLGLIVLLFAFFIAFNILEACQPSLVSRLAPLAAKGSALGVYNTLQALGLFCGGWLGGWLKQQGNHAAVFVLAGLFCAVWLIIAAAMPAIGHRKSASLTEDDANSGMNATKSRAN